jgi:hypothetical protein
MVETVLGNEMEKKLAAVSLSNSSVQRIISDMAIDSKDQVVQGIKSAAFGLFSIQTDELTDVALCSQLLVFARYVHSGSFKEEFLFCSPLETTITASDNLEKVSSFFESEKSFMGYACGCYIDEAPAMLGTISGFQANVKKCARKVNGIHCMIYHQALASKTVPSPLWKVLIQMIQILTFVIRKALNSQLFKQLYIDMNTGHHLFLFHTKV